MWTIRILIPLLTLSLCNAIGSRWRVQIKPLPDKKLLTGQDRNIQNASEPKTTTFTEVPGRVTIHKPSDALVDENFGNYVFTSNLLNHPLQQKLAMTDGNKFVIAEIEANVRGRTVKTFALQFAKQDEAKAQSAYWVPAGGLLQYGDGSTAGNYERPYVDIPIRPTEDDPLFVFTPDFSGCSLTISTFREGLGGKDGFLRIRHVQGGKEDAQFNRLPTEEKGEIVYAMQYKDYGYYRQDSGEIINNIVGFSFMYYHNKHWSIVYQSNQNPQTIAKAVYDTNTRLMSASLMQLQNEIGHPITYVAGFKEFVIPYCILFEHRIVNGTIIRLSACG